MEKGGVEYIDLFRTQSNIQDRDFYERNKRLQAVTYFPKNLHPRCITGFWITRQNKKWDLENSENPTGGSLLVQFFISFNIMVWFFVREGIILYEEVRLNFETSVFISSKEITFGIIRLLLHLLYLLMCMAMASNFLGNTYVHMLVCKYLIDKQTQH